MAVHSIAAADTLDEERFQTGRVATIAASHAVHDTYTAFLPSLLPVFIANLSLSTTGAGLLQVFIQWPSLLQPLIGHLSDRVSLRYLVILAPAVTGIMMSLLGIAPSYAVLAMLLIVAGLSSASIHAVAPVMAGRLSGRSLGRGMGFWMVGGELGRTLGPIVIVTAIRLLTLEGTPWLMIGGLLASIMLYLRLRDVPGRPLEPDQGVPWREALGGTRSIVIPLVGITVVRAFVVAALATYLPTFLTREGVNLWLAGAALSVFQIGGVIGALVAGSVSDRLGRGRVLLVSMVSTSLLMFVFMSITGWFQFPVLLALGFTSLSAVPVLMALVQESFPENRALANGVFMAVTFVIQSGAVVIMGVVGDLFGLRLAYTASAVILLAGVPLVLLLPARAK
jgi:FSR family fosmidomycin resistance protein-like MFS transporter